MCKIYIVISLDTATLATTRYRNAICNFSSLDNTVTTKVDSELCNKNQLDALFTSVCFVSQPLHVSGIFVVHHQEVYCVHTAIGTCCAF